MKQFLKKPLGLAVAATLAMGGMAAFTSANAATNANALGDLAIVPYYTVKNNFITGVQVINTTNATQVVKMRLRRDNDSADILDFNVIMSPFDHFSGYISKVGDAVVFNTTDNTCTAPVNSGTFVSPVPNLSAEADEGYIEVIGMGQANAETEAVAIAAKHGATGTPLNCGFVESNFLIANVLSNSQTQGPSVTGITDVASNGATTDWVNTPDEALKVSYFIRDGASGMEMGDNATHIVGFQATAGAPGAMMTNQEGGGGLANGGTFGFDFPDLNGGGSNTLAANRGLYDSVIRADLGSASILNNWSYNPANNVATDWVITIPGQYLMINPAGDTVAGNGDSIQTDIPVTASLTMYDREEDVEQGGSIVVSPGIPGGSTALPHEVNVIEWGGKSVFGSDNAISANPQASGINQPFGWASLSLTSATNPAGTDTSGTNLGTVVYDLTDPTGGTNSSAAASNVPGGAAGELYPVPVIGFAAWQRKFDTNGDRNYGRIEAHSRK